MRLFLFLAYCVKGVENTLIEEFEQLLATNAFGDPEAIKQHLLRKVEDDRINRMAEIERDFQLCKLIQFGLTLPRETPAYGVARGTINWLRKKFPQDDTLSREMRKACWAIDHDLERSRKNECTELNNDGTGCERTGERMPTGISEGLSAEEQRQSKEMEC